MAIQVWQERARAASAASETFLQAIPRYSIHAHNADLLYVLATDSARAALQATTETDAKQHATIASVAAFALGLIHDLASGD